MKLNENQTYLLWSIVRQARNINKTFGNNYYTEDEIKFFDEIEEFLFPKSEITIDEMPF